MEGRRGATRAARLDGRPAPRSGGAPHRRTAGGGRRGAGRRHGGPCRRPGGAPWPPLTRMGRARGRLSARRDRRPLESRKRGRPAERPGPSDRTAARATDQIPTPGTKTPAPAPAAPQHKTAATPTHPPRPRRGVADSAPRIHRSCRRGGVPGGPEAKLTPAPARGNERPAAAPHSRRPIAAGPAGGGAAVRASPAARRAGAMPRRGARRQRRAARRARAPQQQRRAGRALVRHAAAAA
jgi:hypothetical protein